MIGIKRRQRKGKNKMRKLIFGCMFTLCAVFLASGEDYFASICSDLETKDFSFISTKYQDLEKSTINRIQFGSNGREVINPLVAAIMYQRRDVFTFLINRGGDIGTKVPPPAGFNIAFFAATVADGFFLSEALRLGFDPDTLSDKGLMMLHYAVLYGQKENAVLLIKSMKKIDSWKKVSDSTALIFSAIDSGKLDMVRFVDDQGFVFRAVNGNGDGPIEALFKQKNRYLDQQSMVTYLAKKYPFCVEKQRLAIRCITENWHNPVLLSELQQSGFDVLNEKDEVGNTVLAYLLKEKKFDQIKYFYGEGLKSRNFNSCGLNVDEYMKYLNYSKDDIERFHSCFQ